MTVHHTPPTAENPTKPGDWVKSVSGKGTRYRRVPYPGEVQSRDATEEPTSPPVRISH